MKKYLFTGIFVALIFFLGVFVSKNNQNVGAGGLNIARSCAVSTVTPAGIGHQQSSTILAANNRRAWARIHVGDNATNTVVLSFDEGAAATLTTGTVINGANTNGASSTPYIDFGLNTEFPYTGAVTGITDNGSTTVRITECKF